VDLEAVRTFAAVADAGQFSDAAAGLSVTQQAVSRRIAALERDLGVRLFTRTARGARLTSDGQAFLPHARELLAARDRAVAAVSPARRPLRVDVVGPRLGPAALLRGFHRAHPATPLRVMSLRDGAAAIAAVRDGVIDAAVRAVTVPARQLPDGVRARRVYDEPVELLTGPAHALAGASAVPPAALARHRLWMPGLVPGTEWGAYYDELAAAFGLRIEVTGPAFGTEPLLDVIAASPDLATLVGERTHLLWPAEFGLRRIPLRDPAPAYPHALIWHAGNSHPALAALRRHLAAIPPGAPDRWLPSWARQPPPGRPRARPLPACGKIKHADQGVS
jgi:DNA-binding transcriptional LysR family regulator